MLELLFMLMLCSWSPDQEWNWRAADPDPWGTPVTFYRVYWSEGPDHWWQCRMHSVDAATQCNTPEETVCSGGPDRCCYQTPEPMEPGLFYQVMAVDADGDESTWSTGIKEDCP